MNKSSYAKESNDNSTGAANGGNNNAKEYNQKQKGQHSNSSSSGNKIRPWIAPTADRTVTLQLYIYFKPTIGEIQREAI